jgi:FMN phosphatase YigB (HAD superfamily)
MTALQDIVFLLDVDNTLLDNDQIITDLRLHLEDEFGTTSACHYWAIFEDLRSELGYADYLGALQRYRSDIEYGRINEPRLLLMSSYLVDYPFAQRLYPGAFDVIQRLNTFGLTVILSDGDVVFQPRKIQRSGLWDAVAGRVLVYIHKELMLDSLRCQYPAKHYVMVDDKLRILWTMKQVMGESLTTVFPRQGHYAMDESILANFPAADISIKRIGDLVDFELHTFLGSDIGARAA